MAISANMQQVDKMLQDIPDDRQPMANSLYEELKFMQSTMAQLKHQVETEGAVDLFKQGSQEFWREHPALTAYNKTLGRYNATYKLLIDLLPAPEDKSQSDELMDFIQG